MKSGAGGHRRLHEEYVLIKAVRYLQWQQKTAPLTKHCCGLGVFPEVWRTDHIRSGSQSTMASWKKYAAQGKPKLRPPAHCGRGWPVTTRISSCSPCARASRSGSRDGSLRREIPPIGVLCCGIDQACRQAQDCCQPKWRPWRNFGRGAPGGECPSGSGDHRRSVGSPPGCGEGTARPPGRIPRSLWNTSRSDAFLPELAIPGTPEETSPLPRLQRTWPGLGLSQTACLGTLSVHSLAI